MPERTTAALAPQSQNPLEFHVKPVVLQVHELLVALTTFTLVKVPAEPQAKHEPFVRSTMPAINLHDIQEPDVAERVQTEEDWQVQLPFPLLGVEAGQAKQREPTI